MQQTYTPLNASMAAGLNFPYHEVTGIECRKAVQTANELAGDGTVAANS